MVMRGKVEKSVKSIITVAALVLSCRLALGDSISNLSQIVGRDITQEVCLSMPVGHDFANHYQTIKSVRPFCRRSTVYD